MTYVLSIISYHKFGIKKTGGRIECHRVQSLYSVQANNNLLQTTSSLLTF